MPAEILLLPYADERGETTWILGHFQPLDPLSRLMGRKLVRMRMTANAILTGDAHSPSAVAFAGRQAVKAAPHLKVVAYSLDDFRSASACTTRNSKGAQLGALFFG